MTTLKAIGWIVAGVLTIAGCAMFGGAPVKYSGGVLVNDAGMTLYTFDKDPVGAGRSVCNAQCAAVWPPLKATAEDKPGGDYTIITRDDGSKQWAYKGQPLYLWIKDQKPGDRTGDGFNKVWHVVKEGSRPMGSSY
jgi:predicted lipoprotein with Yx(FWY)xxD motif